MADNAQEDEEEDGGDSDWEGQSKTQTREREPAEADSNLDEIIGQAQPVPFSSSIQEVALHVPSNVTVPFYVRTLCTVAPHVPHVTKLHAK